MNYVILDMEWNQALSADRIVREPVTLTGEIIEIGAVKVGEDMEIKDTFQMMIRPRFYRKIHWKIRKLTGITDQDVRAGVPFRQAVGEFRRWCGDDYAIVIWGNDDISMLKKNLKVHQMDDAWIPGCYNLQVIYNAQVPDAGRNQVSLHNATLSLGEEEMPAHDAFHDAVNTYRVMRHLDMKRGIQEYSSGTGPAISSDRCRFKDREDILKDHDFLSFECPNCGRRMLPEDWQWVRQGWNRMIAVGCCDTCKENGKYYITLRSRTTKDGDYIAIRKVYRMNKERRERFMRQKKEQEERERRMKERGSRNRDHAGGPTDGENGCVCDEDAGSSAKESKETC